VFLQIVGLLDLAGCLVFYFNLGERVGTERVAVWLSLCFVLNPLIFPFYTLLAGVGMCGPTWLFHFFIFMFIKE